MVYTKRDCSVSMEKANWYSLITAGPIVILLGLVYIGIWGYEKPLTEIATLLNQPARLLVANLILIGLLGLGMVLHELIHGVSWMLAGKKCWSAIQFGFQLRTLTPYVHCREPLPIGVYRFGTLMPGMLTGLVPMLVGVFVGNVWIALLGGFFIVAAGGDLLILLLIRNVASTHLIEDHPTRAGCYVLEPAGE